MKKLETLRQKIIQLVEKTPKKAAMILTAWMKQSAKKKGSTKKAA